MNVPVDPVVDVGLVVEDSRWSDYLPGLPELVSLAVNAALSGAGENGPAELGVVLVDDAAVRALNRDYRHKDTPTNVLSFAARETGAPQPPGVPEMLGDVVIAFETALAEAQEAGRPLKDHLCHLLVHGVLHLLGYDHEDDSEAADMERLEIAVLAELGIPDPYSEAGTGHRGVPQDER